MTAQLWQFDAMDRLFFRDGRPFNAGESVWLESEFPPSPRTLQGAVRGAIGDWLGVDWSAYRSGFSAGRYDVAGVNLIEAMGDDTGTGQLRIRGHLLLLNNEPLYPVPLDVIRNEDSVAQVSVKRDTGLRCDIGDDVTVPETTLDDARSMKGHYIDRDGFEAALRGSLADHGSVRTFTLTAPETPVTETPPGVSTPPLTYHEPKVGLARDRTTRTHQESMLYSIIYVRPGEGVRLGVHVAGLRSELIPDRQWLQQLGGEGKLAAIDITDSPADPRSPEQFVTDGERVNIRLVLANVAVFYSGWSPLVSAADATTNAGWQGRLEGRSADGEAVTVPDVQMISACVDDPVLSGGWNLNGQQSRPVQRLAPAGSTYYLQVAQHSLEDIQKLHGGQVGIAAELSYGFGHCFMGTWKWD